MTADAQVETVEFETDDGVRLSGDLATVAAPRGAAIVCHPHPQYGGNRTNNVVEALFTALPAMGVTTLRFDFRPDFGHGEAELLDAAAAVDRVVVAAPGTPVIAAGYSFGAMIALGLDHPDVRHRILVAAPLGRMELRMGPSVPTIVLQPAHDQFAPPQTIEPIVSAWSSTTFETIPNADHMILGRAGWAADRAMAWLAEQLDP
mgnify:CR=1 FL=1